MFSLLSKKQIVYLLNLTVSMMIFLSAYSFMDAVERYITNGFDSISSKLIVISNSSEVNTSRNTRSVSLDWQTYEKLKTLLYDKFHISPVYRAYELLETAGQTRAFPLWRIDHSFFETTGMDILEGRGLSAFEYENYQRKCLISEKSKSYFLPSAGLGKSVLSLFSEPCRIIGITSSREIVPILSMRDNIYIPMNTAGITNPRSKAPLNHIFLRSKDQETDAKAAVDIKNALNIIRKNNTVEVWYAKEFWELQKKVSGNLKVLVLFIASVVIGLAGLSLANNLSLNVVERTGEIGLRLALGATKRNIFLMFLKEGIYIVLVGGTFGIILGVIAVKTIIAPLVVNSGQLGDIGMVIDIKSIFVSLSILLVTALFASIIPAKRATNIDASHAIREI